MQKHSGVFKQNIISSAKKAEGKVTSVADDATDLLSNMTKSPEEFAKILNKVPETASETIIKIEQSSDELAEASKMLKGKTLAQMKALADKLPWLKDKALKMWEITKSYPKSIGSI